MKYDLFKPLDIYHQGQRPNQEDSIFPEHDQATESDRLFIVCDGMGGFERGEVASQTVCRAISRFISVKTDAAVPFTDAMLSDAITYAYTGLDSKMQSADDTKMGTTLAMLYFHAGGVMAAHIGDSRYYHIRPNEHRVVYRSKDHSLVFTLFETGQITEAEMATHEKKNVILRAMMPGQDTPAMPDVVHIKDVRPGDWFLIMSDGMVETMTDDEILGILCDDTLTDEQKRDMFLKETEGNSDNHSAYLIHVNGVTAELIEHGEPDDEEEARANNPLFRNAALALGQSAAVDNATTDTSPTSVVLNVDDNGNYSVESSDAAPTVVPVAAPSFTPQYHTNATPKAKKDKNKGMILGAVIGLAIVSAVFAFFIFTKKSTPAQNNKPAIEDHRIDAGGGSGTVERTRDVRHDDPQSTDLDMNSVTKDIPKGSKTTKTKPGKSTVTPVSDDAESANHGSIPNLGNTSKPTRGEDIINEAFKKREEQKKQEQKKREMTVEEAKKALEKAHQEKKDAENNKKKDPDED